MSHIMEPIISSKPHRVPLLIAVTCRSNRTQDYSESPVPPKGFGAATLLARSAAQLALVVAGCIFAAAGSAGNGGGTFARSAPSPLSSSSAASSSLLVLLATQLRSAAAAAEGAGGRLLVAITDTASLQSAVALWCDDEAAATATYGHISTWNTAGVNDMSRLFARASWGGHCSSAQQFNADISGWQTGAVTMMSDMFYGCTHFNQDISG